MSLANPVTAILVAIGVWWLSTGLVLAMVHWSTKRRLEPWQLLPLVTVFGVAGFLLLLYGSRNLTPLGSYAGFFGALLVWAWHETTFLTGMVTGRRKEECPPGLSGFARFKAAWKAVCDHEIAILVTAVFLWLTLSGGDNLFGLATFGLLWGMRISSKILIFLGARHAVSGLMPPAILHLRTYFNTGRTTPLFPVLLAIATGLFATLVVGACAGKSRLFRRWPHPARDLYGARNLRASDFGAAGFRHGALALGGPEAGPGRCRPERNTIEPDVGRRYRKAPDRRSMKLKEYEGRGETDEYFRAHGDSSLRPAHRR